MKLRRVLSLTRYEISPKALAWLVWSWTGLRLGVGFSMPVSLWKLLAVRNQLQRPLDPQIDAKGFRVPNDPPVIPTLPPSPACAVLRVVMSTTAAVRS